MISVLNSDYRSITIALRQEAGQSGAAFHNGVLWQSLFLQHEMTQVVDNP